MTRIPYVSESVLPEESLEVLNEYAPYVTNIRRIVLHSQKLGPAFIKLGQRFMSEAQFHPRPRQLGILLMSKLTGCEYEWTLHIPNSKKVGVTDEEIAAIASGRWREAGVFSDRDKVVLEFVTSYVGANAVGGALMEALGTHFSSEEVVEMFIGFGFILALIKLMLSAEVDPEEFAGKVYIRKDEAGLRDG